jgi:hypothetical protein
MLIQKIRWKNLLSYGNNWNEYNFENGVDIVFGENGQGKCISRFSKINIKIENEETKKKFEEFLQRKNNGI